MYSSVIITGASSGIGSSLALRYAQSGSNIGIIARRADRLQDLKRQVEQYGVQCVVGSADVADPVSLGTAIQAIVAKNGPCDLFIANAGVSHENWAKGFDAKVAAQTIQVNVIGAMNGVAAVLPAMIEARKGHIVGISSLASYTSFPGAAVYSASKAALSRWLEAMRIELQRYGVDVTTVCPGFIRTDMTSENQFYMPFLLDLEPAVDRIVHAIETKAAVYNFPRRTYWLIQLQRFLPRKWVVGVMLPSRKKRLQQ